MGGSFFGALMDAGFQEIGGLYPVNPKADEINGFKCYPTLLDTPDPVDYVISQVPAHVVPELVDQCIAKKIRCIHFFTAGFSETGDPERAKMERESIAKLQKAGIRAIGPNCMGMYVPRARLQFMGGFPMEGGNVFLLSQSGANAGEIVRELTSRGIRFSKVISYGNGSDLKAHDFLDYAATDEETDVVAAYIEGVQEGRKFFESLKRCARNKRVVILKGGRTQSGSFAAHSHTGSLAGAIEVFDAACRQAGAVRAETMEDLQDLVVAAATGTCNVGGPGVLLFGGGGGGFAVLSSDIIDRAGLTVPQMPKDRVAKMREYIPVAGSSVNNPIDAFPPPDFLEEMLRLVATAPGVDMMFMAPMTGRRGWGPPNRSQGQADEAPTDPEEIAREAKEAAEKAALQMRRVQDDTGTTVLGYLRGGRMGAMMMGVDNDVLFEAAYRQGIGVYPSVTRAARAAASVLEWRRYREGLPDIF